MKRERKFIPCVIALAIMIGVMFLLYNLSSYYTHRDSNSIMIDNGWKIMINDKTYENQSIHHFHFQVVSKGDTLVLKNKLPDKLVRYPILKIYTVHSDVDVSIDGKSIYRYGQADRKKNRLLGYGYHYIDLPKDYVGKSMSITMHITEDDAFSSLMPIEINNSKTEFQTFISNNCVKLLICSFLLIFGLGIFFVTGLLILLRVRYFKLVCVGLFAIVIGAWSICNYNLIQLFTPDLHIKVYMEFISFYLLEFPVYAYFYDDVKRLEKRWVLHLYWTLIGLDATFTVFMFVCQGLNIFHLPQGVKAVQVFCVIMTGFLLPVVYARRNRRSFSHNLILYGIAILGIFASADIIKFNVKKYLCTSSGPEFNNSLSVGTLIFITILMLDYCMDIRKACVNETRQSVLEQMAYTDVLTGLYNRRKCEEVMRQLEVTTKSGYGIISIDLNGLKRTNDEYGHNTGDKLIRGFSKSLRHYMEPYGIVGRMGGDEFIVIIKHLRCFDLMSTMTLLQKDLDRQNENLKSYKYSMAYGYATSHDVDKPKALDVYKLADHRMYQQKQAMKHNINLRKEG